MPDFNQEPGFFKEAYRRDREGSEFVAAFSDFCIEQNLSSLVDENDSEAGPLQYRYVKSIRNRLLELNFTPTKVRYLTYRDPDSPLTSVISGIFIGGDEVRPYAIPVWYSKKIRDEEATTLVSLKIGLPSEEIRAKKTGLGIELFKDPIAVFRSFRREHGEIAHSDSYFLSEGALEEAVDRASLRSESIQIAVDREQGSPIPVCEEGTLLIAIAAQEVRNSIRERHGAAFFLNGITRFSVLEFDSKSAKLSSGFHASVFNEEGPPQEFIMPEGIHIDQELEVTRLPQGPLKAHTVSYREYAA